jgi:hypothetical protein
MSVMGFVCLVAILSGTPASADAPDGDSPPERLGEVAVLPAAGTGEVRLFEAESSPNTPPSKARVRQTGTRQLLPEGFGPSTFTDLEITGRRSHLVAGVGGRGAAWIAPSGDGSMLSAPFVLSPGRERNGIGAASVVATRPGGRPGRIVFAESSRRRLTIYDVRLESPLWSYRLTSPTTRSEIVQVVAAPEHRLVYAANWPDESLSAVDVLDLEGRTPSVPTIRFANAPSNAPEPTRTVIDERLSELRDVSGLSDGRLLVTTSDWLLVLDPSSGSVVHAFELAAHPDLTGGVFVSARPLPSGNIVAATAEPGLWNRPAPNHRVYWLDADLSTILARTPPLSQAPWRVEPSEAYGGSGTLGFAPDDDFLPRGDLDGIQMPSGLQIDPAPLRIGTRGRLTATLLQTDRFPVVLSRLQLAARRGRCRNDPESEATRWLERRDVVLRSRVSRSIRTSVALPTSIQRGEWCVGLRGRRADDTSWTAIGSQRTVRIVASGADTGPGEERTIDPIDIGVRYYGDTTADVSPSNDGSNAPSGREPVLDPPTGCGCGTSRLRSNRPPSMPWPWWVCVGIAWAFWRGRCCRT